MVPYLHMVATITNNIQTGLNLVSQKPISVLSSDGYASTKDVNCNLHIAKVDWWRGNKSTTVPTACTSYSKQSYGAHQCMIWLSCIIPERHTNTVLYQFSALTSCLRYCEKDVCRKIKKKKLCYVAFEQKATGRHAINFKSYLHKFNTS